MEAKQRKDRYEPIYFIKDDFSDTDQVHNDPIVISALVHNFLVKRILVDQRRSADILYSHAAKTLGLEKDAYNTYTSMLIGFTKGQVQVCKNS